MSRRGPCKKCTWLSKGRICRSEKAMKLTPKGRLKPFFNEKVKELLQYWDKRLKRMVTKSEYDGCFLCTLPGRGARGVSGFQRRRAQC